MEKSPLLILATVLFLSGCAEIFETQPVPYTSKALPRLACTTTA